MFSFHLSVEAIYIGVPAPCCQSHPPVTLHYMHPLP